MKFAAQNVLLGAGLILHTAILLLPVLLFGSSRDATAWLLIACAGLSYWVEAAAAAKSILQPDMAFADDTASDLTKTADILAHATGLTLLLIFWLSLTTRMPNTELNLQRSALVIIGAAMMLGGAMFRRLAMRRLGAFFVSEPRVVAGQLLVTDGIYNFVRHPSESGLLMIGLGAAVMRNSMGAGIVGLAVLLPLALIRIRIEESVLLAGFDRPYRQYIARTWALVPKLF